MGRGEGTEGAAAWRSELEEVVGKTVVAVEDHTLGLGGGSLTLIFDDGTSIEVTSETGWDYGYGGETVEYATIKAELHEKKPEPEVTTAADLPAEPAASDPEIKKPMTLAQRLLAEAEDSKFFLFDE